LNVKQLNCYEKECKKIGLLAAILTIVGFVLNFIPQVAGTFMFLNIKSCQNIEQKQGDINVNIGRDILSGHVEHGDLKKAAVEQNEKEIVVKKENSDAVDLPDTSEVRSYRNDIFHIKAHSVTRSDKGLLLDLTIQNISDKEICLAFNSRNSQVYLKGNSGGIYYSDEKLSRGATGLSHVYFNGIIYDGDYECILPGRKIYMPILFVPIEGGIKNDSVFIFKSTVLSNINRSVKKWGVGIGDISY